MLLTQVLENPEVQRDERLVETLRQVFGRPEDPMSEVDRRANELLAGKRAIVWEGDAATFQFSYVGGAAEDVLGHPARYWTEQPTFWADTVVHPDDRDEAIAFCALATGKCQDHDFVYRAQSADGKTVWLHDVVTVLRSPSGVAAKLRGVMIDVTDELANGATPAT